MGDVFNFSALSSPVADSHNLQDLCHFDKQNAQQIRELKINVGSFDLSQIVLYRAQAAECIFFEAQFKRRFKMSDKKRCPGKKEEDKCQ